jgi:uncharacterized protein (DUF2249 family)
VQACNEGQETMQKYNLNDLIEFNDVQFNPQVVINESNRRVMLISMCAGHSIPEHSAPGKVTVHALEGHVTFFEGETPCDLRAGEMVSIESGSKHRLEGHADSVLLVTVTGMNQPAEALETASEVLDIREVPRPLRHPMIFAKFDALPVGGELRLINDHDPIPLNRQFERMRPAQARWEYDQRGPQIFRIRVTRVGPPSASDTPLQNPAHGVQLQP